MKKLIQWVTKKMLKSVGITVFEVKGKTVVFIGGDVQVKNNVYYKAESLDTVVSMYL